MQGTEKQHHIVFINFRVIKYLISNRNSSPVLPLSFSLYYHGCHLCGIIYVFFGINKYIN